MLQQNIEEKKQLVIEYLTALGYYVDRLDILENNRICWQGGVNVRLLIERTARKRCDWQYVDETIQNLLTALIVGQKIAPKIAIRDSVSQIDQPHFSTRNLDVIIPQSPLNLLEWKEPGEPKPYDTQNIIYRGDGSGRFTHIHDLWSASERWFCLVGELANFIDEEARELSRSAINIVTDTALRGSDLFFAPIGEPITKARN